MRHQIAIKTLTPVHIGSGNELNGNFEYVYFPKEEAVVVMEPSKIMEVIGEENVNKWVSAIEKQENLLTALPMLKSVKPSDIALRIINIRKSAPDPTRNAIKEQLFLSNGKPGIPGSSLKGSIRTAILTKLIKERPAFVAKEEHLKNRFGRYSDEKIVAEYMGKEKAKWGFRHSPNKDLLRFLRVGDFCFDRKTIVVKTEVVNFFRHGWGLKRDLSSFWECIPTGAVSKSSLQIPGELLQRVSEKHYISSDKLKLLNINRLFELVNAHTLHLLDREIEMWEEEGNPQAIGDLLEFLYDLRAMAKKADGKTCVLRVGAGSGWEFMTGAWPNDRDVYGEFILEDRTWAKLKGALRRGHYSADMPFPKTRKILDEGIPFGFVQLTLI